MDNLFDLWYKTRTGIFAEATDWLPMNVRFIEQHLTYIGNTIKEMQMQQWIQIGIGAAITVLLLLIYLELRKQRKEKTKSAEDSP